MEVFQRKILITGASGGIGKELVKQLLYKGAIVYGVDINKKGLKQLEEELNNPNLKTYQLDISDQKEITKFHKKFIKENGNPDILLNNAGIVQPFIKVIDLTDEIIEHVMNVNFYGPLNLIRLFLPNLIEKQTEGYIVNVSSMAGFFPFPSQSIYGASKAALKIFTEGLYAELKNTNIKVLAVMPGAIETDILKNSGVEYKTDKDASSYKMTSAYDTAYQIINAIEQNKFRIFIGSDSKFMNMLYKLSPKKAIDFINKKMN